MPMISGAQKQQFVKQGYLVAKGLLDVEADIEPFKRDYTEFLDSLAAIFIAKANPSLAADYGALSLAERVAILFGCRGRSVLDHLDPTLIILRPGYQRQKGPSHRAAAGAVPIDAQRSIARRTGGAARPGDRGVVGLSYH